MLKKQFQVAVCENIISLRLLHVTFDVSQVMIPNYCESNLTKDTLPKKSDVSFNNVCNHNN